jgi:hypothetical protein
MGPVAYPHLVRYIDHEDPLLGRAAVAVLNALTGRNAPLPTEASKTRHRSEWQAWIGQNAPPSLILTPDLLALLEGGATEREVRGWIDQLSDDDPAERRKAAVALRPCALRHEDLLRRCRAEARDAEIAARLDEVLAYLQSMQAALSRVRSDPKLLLKGVPPGTPLEARRKQLAEWLQASAKPSENLILLWNQRAFGSAEERAAARKEIDRLETQARQELDTLGKKAMLLREDGRKAEALEILKAARPRFELTGLAAELQKLIEESEK